MLGQEKHANNGVQAQQTCCFCGRRLDLRRECGSIKNYTNRPDFIKAVIIYLLNCSTVR